MMVAVCANVSLASQGLQRGTELETHTNGYAGVAETGKDVHCSSRNQNLSGTSVIDNERVAK